MFIEYDGEFHDTAEMHKGELELNKERDERKDSRAEKLGIPILRITYKEQNKVSELWLRERIQEVIGAIN